MGTLLLQSTTYEKRLSAINAVQLMINVFCQNLSSQCNMNLETLPFSQGDLPQEEPDDEQPEQHTAEAL